VSRFPLPYERPTRHVVSLGQSVVHLCTGPTGLSACLKATSYHRESTRWSQGKSHARMGDHYRKALDAAEIVWSISSSVWARETNIASKALGAR